MSSSASSTRSAPASGTVDDNDRDALHILPLALVPLQTPALQRARIVKNANLESVVELFSDAGTGSGQIGIEDLPMEFGWSRHDPHDDHIVIRKLGLQPSFDVYSLRLVLRHHGIGIADATCLKLSNAKNAELTHYMSRFTRPLIRRVYGRDGMDVDTFEALIALFQSPDTRTAVGRLKMLASSLDIPVHQVPQFLEDYGDVFLSLSYFRETLDRLTPSIEDFQGSLLEIADNQQLKRERQTVEGCKSVYVAMESALRSVREQLAHFDHCTLDLWKDVTAARFREFRREVTGSHTTIGGILCALSVKLEAWMQAFPVADAGSPLRRANFIVNDMRRGIERIRHLQASVPSLVQKEA